MLSGSTGIADPVWFRTCGAAAQRAGCRAPPRRASRARAWPRELGQSHPALQTRRGLTAIGPRSSPRLRSATDPVSFPPQCRLIGSSALNQSGAEGRAVTHVQPDCRIYLVVEAGPAAIEDLSAVVSAADVACCLIVPAPGKATTAASAKPIVAAAQRAGVAALLANDVDLARTVAADGVHLDPAPSLAATYAAVRQRLGRDAIVGADAGVSRHDAMSLAEAGADYIAFGAPAHLLDRSRARQRRDDLVTWWGEIFGVACVALDVETPAEADRLAQAGANFVAVRFVPGEPASSRELVRQIGAALGAGAAAD